MSCGAQHTLDAGMHCRLESGNHREHLWWELGKPDGVVPWPNEEFTEPVVQTTKAGAKRKLDALVEEIRSDPVPSPEPKKFAGETYVPELDEARLTRQYDRVRSMMGDGQWRTLAEIVSFAGGSEAAVSARLRDLRKPENGGHEVERRRRGNPTLGLFEYRLVI